MLQYWSKSPMPIFNILKKKGFHVIFVIWTLIRITKLNFGGPKTCNENCIYLPFTSFVLLNPLPPKKKNRERARWHFSNVMSRVFSVAICILKTLQNLRNLLRE